MSITTIARGTLILLVFALNTAWAQSFEEGVAAYDRGDYQTAFEVFQSFAEEGAAGAQFNLGLLYHTGNGVARNHTKAANWYRAAAEQGLANAQNNLAIFYSNGLGVIQDYSKAVRWYRSAAVQGFKYAQYDLAVLYVKGAGVSRSLVKAHMWLNIASANGSKKARKYRNKIAAQMSSSAVAKAQKRAQECKESGLQGCN